MPELVDIISLTGGLVVLGLAGNFLVRGAVSIARKMGVSPLVAGIFIVGFGTSLPELFVAFDAALAGYPNLALGNIVGSNIANIWLVLAAPAVLATIRTGGFGQRSAISIVLFVTFAWIAITAFIPLDTRVGIAFFVILAAFAVFSLVTSRQASAAGEDVGLDEVLQDDGTLLSLVLVIIGIIGLPVGAQLIVDGGVGLAAALNVSDELIGLTLLAVGTSLPEIGAGVAAALRGRSDVVIGNVLGSNLFNILGAGGIISFFGPITVGENFHAYSHWILALSTLSLALFVLPRGRIGRLAGILMLLLYAVYIYGLIKGWNIQALYAATI